MNGLTAVTIRVVATQFFVLVAARTGERTVTWFLMVDLRILLRQERNWISSRKEGVNFGKHNNNGHWTGRVLLSQKVVGQRLFGCWY